jgi:hypothetical protein
MLFLKVFPFYLAEKYVRTQRTSRTLPWDVAIIVFFEILLNFICHRRIHYRVPSYYLLSLLLLFHDWKTDVQLGHIWLVVLARAYVYRVRRDLLL